MGEHVWWLTAAVAAGLSLALSPLLARALPSIGFLAVPNERSSHTRATPTGVGVCVPAAVLAAVLLSTGVGATAPLAPALLLSILGLASDVWDLQPRWRLVGQFLLAVSGTIVIGLSYLLIVPAALVVVAAVNGLNFMDGINGITALHGILFGGALVFAASIAAVDLWQVIGLAMAASCLGFLPYNFPRARAFPGDVLPYFLAGTYTVGLMDTALQQPVTLLGVGALVPMALDTSHTIIDRARSGHALVRAHRGHAYQRLARRTTHATASLTVLTLSALCAISLPLGVFISPWAGISYLGFATIVTATALASIPKDI